MKVEFKVSELGEVLGKLNNLKVEARNETGRFALRKAANIIKDAAKKNASALDDPSTSEKIADNIAVRWSSRRFKRTGDMMFRVGILGGARQYVKTRENVRKGRVGKTYVTGGTISTDKKLPGGDTYYWRFLEFGTKHMGAKPFFEHVLGANSSKAINEFTTQFNKKIARDLKKARKANPR